MPTNRLRYLVVGLTLLVAACDPEKTEETAADGGRNEASTATTDAGAGSIACYSAEQFYCEENPQPTADQSANLPVSCSSVSGVFSMNPAACPPAGFLGKCTMGDVKNPTIRRYYTGADAAYLQDFCVNTAMGAWSTTV
jgi:hypothetical protein